ncbi:MAG: acyl-CoA dehydrogenase family protein, partial [Actinomycetota bacterium]|nr:acyl-CoA dehydrogenase family protein [Actinomycetota bacterium]
MADLLSPELRELKGRMKTFINDVVIPVEPTLMREDDTTEAALADLKEAGKDAGLWALGHPEEIGGGGLPFMDFVYLNEVIGRSHWGQWAVGSLSMQDSIMLHLYASDEQRERFLSPLVAGEVYP